MLNDARRFEVVKKKVLVVSFLQKLTLKKKQKFQTVCAIKAKNLLFKSTMLTKKKEQGSPKKKQIVSKKLSLQDVFFCFWIFVVFFLFSAPLLLFSFYRDHRNFSRNLLESKTIF